MGNATKGAALRLIAGILLLNLAAQPCSVAVASHLWRKAPGSQSNLFAFQRNGKVGFIDADGKIRIPATIEADILDVGDFVDGRARVRNEGFIDQRGEFVLRGDYWMLSDLAGGVVHARVQNDPSEYVFDSLFFDRGGKELGKTSSNIVGDFSEGLVAFEAPGKPSVRQFRPTFIYIDYPGLKGFMDRSGNTVIPAKFAQVGAFVDGLAPAVVDGYCAVIIPESYSIGSPTSGMWNSCGGAPNDAKEACKVGFIDRSGEFAIPAVYDSARDFAEGMAAVMTGAKWGYINRKGDIAIAATFDEARSFSENMAAVKIGRRWGFVDKSGKVAVQAEYDEVEPFSDGLALATRNQQRMYINRAGRIVLRGNFLEANSFVQGLAPVRFRERRVSYIDKSGATVFEYDLANPR